MTALRAAAGKPVHAYMFVGPPGTGKMQAAVAFAAMLLCPNGGEDACETCRRVFEGTHPDLVVVEREGAFVSIGQAQEVTRLAARALSRPRARLLCSLTCTWCGTPARPY